MGPVTREGPSLGSPCSFPQHSGRGTRQGEAVPENVSASLSSQHKLLFFCPKQSKKSPSFSQWEWPPLCVGNPPGMKGGRSARDVQQGK